MTKRWTLAEVDGVLSALRAGRAPQPFGLTDGKRVDLRGMPIPDCTKLYGLHLRDYDLSGARLDSGWVENCVFQNVCFQAADLSGLADHGNRFQQCVFDKTNFRTAVLGYKGTEYEACRFARADFARTAFIRPEFNGCQFLDCKLNGVDFNASSFVDCTFEGLLKNVWFRGEYGFPGDSETFGPARPNEMQNVSFANAELRDVEFTNHCDLSSIILPRRGDYRLYSPWRPHLERLRELSKEWSPPDRSEAELFLKSNMVHVPNQDSYLLNCDDLKRDFGIELGSRILDALG